MIPITLLEKFGSQSFVTSTEICKVTRHSCSKLKNVNTIRRTSRFKNKREMYNVKIKIKCVCDRMKHKRLKLINTNLKHGASVSVETVLVN